MTESRRGGREHRRVRRPSGEHVDDRPGEVPSGRAEPEEPAGGERSAEDARLVQDRPPHWDGRAERD